MRDKLKPPTDYSGNDPVRYYLYDIAISLRLLTAQKETPGMSTYDPLSFAPGENSPMMTSVGCTCQACTPGGAAYLKTYGKVVEAEEGLSTGSMSPAEAVKRLGYEDPDELRRLRELEEAKSCSGCMGGRCDECPTDDAGYALKVEEATQSPVYNFGSKYFRVPSGEAKGKWYLHVDGRYYWRPDEG